MKSSSEWRTVALPPASRPSLASSTAGGGRRGARTGIPASLRYYQRYQKQRRTRLGYLTKWPDSPSQGRLFHTVEGSRSELLFGAGERGLGPPRSRSASLRRSAVAASDPRIDSESREKQGFGDVSALVQSSFRPTMPQQNRAGGGPSGGHRCHPMNQNKPIRVKKGLKNVRLNTKCNGGFVPAK